jgi:Xaa-Pro dipeptidase
VVLRENMTFHIIPWLFGLDGDKVMGISETVRVTPTGAERLIDVEPQLFVAA